MPDVYDPRAKLIDHLTRGNTPGHRLALGDWDRYESPSWYLAVLDPCGDTPRSPGGSPSVDMGRDVAGYRVRRTATMDFRVSECCGKDATAEEAGVLCRRCKEPIDEGIGGRPEPPYVALEGHVTATKLLGWGG